MAEISLPSVGGDLTSGNISSGIQNQDGGTINTGGDFNLSVLAGLTTTQIAYICNLGVNNFNGGSIDWWKSCGLGSRRRFDRQHFHRFE